MKPFLIKTSDMLVLFLFLKLLWTCVRRRPNMRLNQGSYGSLRHTALCLFTAYYQLCALQTNNSLQSCSLLVFP